MEKNKNTKKIKICCVVSSDITLRFMLLGQLNFLLKQEYDVYAVCSDGEHLKYIEGQGIKVKKIKFKRKIFTPISDIKAFVSLYFYFRKEKFSVVHVHTLKPEFYGQIAAKLAGVPVILNTLHGFDFAEDDISIKKSLFLFIEKIAAKCSTRIFVIGKHIIKRAIKEKIGKIELFKYLGRDIDTDRFDPDKFSESFIIQKKKELGISSDKKIIGIVARLVVEKGYLNLFEAFRVIVKKHPNILLLVIGQHEPEKRDAISLDIVKKYEIEKNVVFLGERIDIEELYFLMDIFVLPTHREGLGAAILEASSMQKPVIVGDIGGCPETIDNGITGILVPVKNTEKLIEAIDSILDNPQIGKEMGRRGREKIVKEFRKEIIFERLEKNYKELIDKHVL